VDSFREYCRSLDDFLSQFINLCQTVPLPPVVLCKLEMRLSAQSDVRRGQKDSGEEFQYRKLKNSSSVARYCDC
ncbi:MAG: hypothetical protein QOD84_898, partial [Acidobacteriaceae bacterium]